MLNDRLAKDAEMSAKNPRSASVVRIMRRDLNKEIEMTEIPTPKLSNDAHERIKRMTPGVRKEPWKK